MLGVTIENLNNMITGAISHNAVDRNTEFQFGSNCLYRTNHLSTFWNTPIICILVFLMLATTLPAKEFLVYFGTYTNALSRGIYVSRLDAKTGKLSAPELAAAVGNPNFVNLSRDGKHLYSSSSVTDGGDGFVSAFAVNKTSGQLTLLNQLSSGGKDPCHVSVDADDKTVFVANYDNGSVKSIPLLADGSLGSGGSLMLTSGRSVNPARQTGPHAHFITVDPSNHFALACNLGTDKVMIYRLNADSTLTPNNPPFAIVPAGAGARHLVFSRDGQHAYVVNEMGCSVSLFDWDAKSGSLALRETVSALPSGVKVKPAYTAAEILLSPDGKFIYVTLRGHDSVTVFAVDKKSGQLTFVQNLPSGGKVPRGLGIDPTGHWLITGHQQSNNAVEFAIDIKTGKLTPTGAELKIGSPVDVKFVKAD